jgi:hypothetical protein
MEGNCNEFEGNRQCANTIVIGPSGKSDYMPLFDLTRRKGGYIALQYGKASAKKAINNHQFITINAPNNLLPKLSQGNQSTNISVLNLRNRISFFI